MAASLKKIALLKTAAKYGNFRLFERFSFSRQAASLSADDNNPPRSTVSDYLKEIKRIIEESNDDMPVPDMTNPYTQKKQLCVLCKYGIELNYKNAKLLSQFVSQVTGKIYSKHITKLCDEQYVRLEKCVRMSQHAGYMPYMHKDLAFVHDPKVFDVSIK